MNTIDNVLSGLPRQRARPLPRPHYEYDHEPTVSLGSHVAMTVPSMAHHMTDEGWQIMLALGESGYHLWGHKAPFDCADVRRMLVTERPSVVVVQDKREWEGRTAGGPRTFDVNERFTNVTDLAGSSVFRLTILKDAQNDGEYNRLAALEIACHAWIVYYHPRIVSTLCPWLRPEHLIRTYHTVDANLIPPYSHEGRKGCLLSGAVSGAYPLRARLHEEWRSRGIPDCDLLPHPGYHRNGCQTPAFYRTLSNYKVAVCTGSRYGYLLRKIIEATACGCVVITDLPEDDEVPGIDDNLVRVKPDIPMKYLRERIAWAVGTYCRHRQYYYACTAKDLFDYRMEGFRLANQIETLRVGYSPDQ